MENAKKFYQTIMYSGLPGECSTETWVCMYQKQMIKTSWGKKALGNIWRLMICKVLLEAI